MPAMAMVGQPPPTVPHHMTQTDPLEYSRYMASMWFAQYDRDGSLQRFRHYIPHFVLQSFCTTDRLKVQQSAGRYNAEESPIDEADTLVIYDPQTKRFDKRHWSECYGEANIYERHFGNFKPSTFAREQWRPFETVQRLDREIFSALIDPVWKIYQNYQSGMIPMRRGDINKMRKFLFLTTSLRNRDRNQHLLAKDPNMDDARIRRKKFMEAHALDHPRDLWLQHADLILESRHFDIATDPDIFDLDREDYRANARERFAVFWEAGPGEEFVLTDNAFGCFEGGGLGARKKLTIEMTAREHEVRTYTRDFMWHQLYVLSPKLVLALCHGTLLHPNLTKAQRRRWGLRRSLLEELPHPLANNYYKDLAKGEVAFLKQGWEVPPEVEKLFGQPRWDGKVIAIENREQDELVFTVSMLSAEQVSLVNCVLLQNQSSAASPVQSVSFRPPSSYRSLHESLVKFTEIVWSKYTDEKQNTYDGLEKRLSQYLSKLDDVRSNGSAPSVRPGIFTPPIMTPDPSSDGREAPRRVEKPSKPETVVTVSSEIKRERRKSVVPEFSRFEQGLPTPPQTQPQSRESSIPPPIPPPPAIPNLRTPASSMPPPPSQNSRAPSSERPILSVVTERPVPYRARAPSSDRVTPASSTAATTCEVPTRRATVSSPSPPQPFQQQQEEKRGASRDRSSSIRDGIRVEPSPPPPMPELKREQPSRNPSAGPPEQRPTPPQRPTGQRRFSMAQQHAPPPPPPPAPAQDKRQPSMERRFSEAPQPRAESLPRPQVMEKRQPTPGTEVPQTQTQPASVPVPQPKATEKRNVSTEQKPESRQPSQSPPVRSPSQNPPQNANIPEERTENPKLSPALLEHIERQRRIEQQRAEQERVKAEQERAARERAEQDRINRERAEKERQERQQRAEQDRINREREQERLNQERARKRAELERLEQERVKAEQLKAEQERQRIEQQRIEEQRRADQLRLEQEHQRRVEQERRNLEQVRLEQQQIHQQQQRAALEQQRKDMYNRTRERSTSAHSTNTLAEAIRADKARFEGYESQSPSELSVDSTTSGSSRSSGSSGSGSMPSSKASDRTERPVKIRGGSASPRRHTITHARDTAFAKFLQVPYDAETVCDVAESMIVEPDDDDELWVDEGYAEAPPQRELELFAKPRKPIVRFASPKPTKMFNPHSPTGGRKATIMSPNNKVRYAGHVQHAQGGALHAQHPMHINQPHLHHNVYPSHREY